MSRFLSRRLALLVLLGGPLVADAQTSPLPWHDPAPLARLFLQLPFEDARRMPAGDCLVRATTTEANNLLIASNYRFQLEVDSETSELRLGARCGVGAGVDVSVEIPLLVDWGGFMDQGIGAIESIFGAENPARRSLRPGRTVYIFRQTGDGALTRTHPLWSIGDVSAGAGVSLVRNVPGLAVTAKVAAKAPTAHPTFGSGEADLGVSLVVLWTRHPVTLQGQLDAGFPTGRLRPLNLALGPYVNGHFGVAVEMGAGLSFHFQVSAHTSALRGTGLEWLRLPTSYVLAGLGWAITPRITLQLGAVENVFSYQRGADFSVLLNAQGRFGR